MEPKNSSEEHTSYLKSLGFDKDQIKKLLNLTDKDLKKLLFPKSKLEKKNKRGDYIIFYTIKCKLCGGEQVEYQVASCYKEWTALHPFYQTGRGVYKIESCPKCRKWLESLSKNKIIDILLGKKEDLWLNNAPLPKIIYGEDKEYTNYPLVVVNMSSVHCMNNTNNKESQNEKKRLTKTNLIVCAQTVDVYIWL